MQNTVIALLCLSGVSQSAYWRRPKSDYMKRYKERSEAEVQTTMILGKMQSSKYIFDTRTAEERADHDISKLPLDGVQIINVAYDNFYGRERFFNSFVAGNEHYDASNDGQDVGIFDLPAEFYESGNRDELPESVAAVGPEVTIICGSRWCGCRWNLMWDHGFRGMAWYVDDVNDFITNYIDNNQ